MLSLITKIFVLLTIIICIYCIYKDIKKFLNEKNSKTKPKRKKKKEIKKEDKIILFLDKNRKIILKILIIVSAILYLFKLSNVPSGLNVDEAGTFFDAMSLAKYGIDRYLYHFPVYFINFGGGQNALYTYLVATLFKIFDNNLFILRLPAVIFGILSIVYFYKLLEKEENSIVGLFGAVLMLITPFFIRKSRWGLESYLLLPLLLLSIYSFFNAIKKDKKSLYLLSGILFGITLYTYALSYIVLALFLSISCLYLLITKKVKIKNIIIMAIPVVLFATPLILFLAVNNGIIENEIVTRFISIPKLFFYRGSEISFSNIITNLKDLHIFKVIFFEDGLSWNSNIQSGTLYYISIPIIIYGLICSIKRTIIGFKNKDYNLDIAMLLVFVITFCFSILLSDVNINKINCLYLPLIYYVTIGLYNIYINNRKLLIIVSIMYFALFAKFLNYYFVTYPAEYKDTWLFVSNDFNNALSFAKKNEETNQKIYVNGIEQPYIYTLIYDETSPYDFNDTLVRDGSTVKEYGNYIFTLDDIDDENIIYLVKEGSSNYEKIKELNLKEKVFGKYIVFYK